MTEEKRNSLLRYVAALKAKGVTGIKVELEAQMHREDDFYDEDDCLRWLLDDIVTRTGVDADFDRLGSNSIVNPFPWMKYAKFYDDGSVDSELTFTVKLNDPTNIFYLPQVIESFRAMADANGHGFRTSGAGMHMALLFNPSCQYPSATGLALTRRRHFKRAVTQLLPALYFLAAADDTTRSIGDYRAPRISMEYHSDAMRMGNPKYSAISYRHGAMEFRVFDTCYDKPEQIFDNIAVMANCIKYATLAYRSPNLNKICSNMTFGHDTSRQLDRLYVTETHLDILNAGLKLLKPDYYTIRELKAQRKFTRTKTTVKNFEKEYAKQAQAEFDEYQERFKWREYVTRMQYQAAEVDNAARSMLVAELQETNPETISARVQARIDSDMESWTIVNQREAVSYIADRIRRLQQHTNNGNYELSFE